MFILKDTTIDELLDYCEYRDKHPLSEEEKKEKERNDIEDWKKFIEDIGIYDTDEKREEALKMILSPLNLLSSSVSEEDRYLIIERLIKMDDLTSTTIDELMAMVEYDEKHPLSEEEIKKQEKENDERQKFIDDLLLGSVSEDEEDIVDIEKTKK